MYNSYIIREVTDLAHLNAGAEQIKRAWWLEKDTVYTSLRECNQSFYNPKS